MSDVKGWESSFSDDLAYATTRVIAATCSNPGIELDRALLWWKYVLFANLGYLDDGTLIEFKERKVQRSGNFLTTSSNGIGRSVCARYCGSVPFCCGDDCNEWPTVSNDELMRKYKSIGLTLRDVSESDGVSYDFCSHTYRKVQGEWVCWLSAWERMIFTSSIEKKYDYGTNLNWISEIYDMPDLILRKRIMDYIECRTVMLTSPGGYEESKEQQRKENRCEDSLEQTKEKQQARLQSAGNCSYGQ